MPTVKKHLLSWACSISVHAIHLSNYNMKYELSIGGICLMGNVMVNCTKQRTGLDTRSIAIYGNVSLPFLKHVLVIVSIILSSITKMVMFLKIILRYHSVPD